MVDRVLNMPVVSVMLLEAKEIIYIYRDRSLLQDQNKEELADNGNWQVYISKTYKLCRITALISCNLFSCYCSPLHCMKSALNWRFSDSYISAFGLNTERYFSSPTAVRYVKNVRKTPNTGTFHAVLCLWFPVYCSNCCKILAKSGNGKLLTIFAKKQHDLCLTDTA